MEIPSNLQWNSISVTITVNVFHMPRGMTSVLLNVRNEHCGTLNSIRLCHVVLMQKTENSFTAEIGNTKSCMRLTMTYIDNVTDMRHVTQSNHEYTQTMASRPSL